MNKIKHWVIMGDAHRRVLEQIDRVWTTFPHYAPLETAIIFLGDVGINIFQDESDKALKEAINKTGYTLYCLRGNHELRANQVPDMKRNYDETVNGFVYYEEAFPHIYYFEDTVGAYTINGYSILTIGGAYSIDKVYRLASGYFWNPEEELTEEEMRDGINLARGNYYDFVFSHTCPFSFMPTWLFLPNINQKTITNKMEWYLEDLSKKCEWKNWLFAHFHDDVIIKPHVELLYQEPHDLDFVFSYWKRYDLEDSPFLGGENND